MHDRAKWSIKNFLRHTLLFVRNRQSYDSLQYANYTKGTRKEDIYQHFTFSGISIMVQTKLIVQDRVRTQLY